MTLRKFSLRKFSMMAVLALAAQAQPRGCNTNDAPPSVTIALPSHPFAVTPSRDGCSVFVSLMDDDAEKNGIAVLKRDGARIELSRVVPLESPPAGIVLTNDGEILIAAALDAVIFLDVQRMIEGAANPVLGLFRSEPDAESIYVNVTPDDEVLFVSEEGARSITVIDLERARANGYKSGAIIGNIPTGHGPIALTFSPDGNWLYTTSQMALDDWKWPKSCKPEGLASTAELEVTSPEGAVIVVDVARARTDPAQSVVARVPAGCSPVRAAISPRGDRLYVTARNNNAVLAFDTAKLRSDVERARVGVAPVGPAPVPIAVVADGSLVVVGNSNRFGGSPDEQGLVVLDAAAIQANAKLGTIPAGEFPRDMSVSADGRTLFLTNFGSNSLQVMGVAKLPVGPR